MLDRRHLYVLRSSRYKFRYKIGISNHVERRRREVDDSLRGGVGIITSRKILFAYFWEQCLHKLYFPLNARMKGSGKTEWFWFVFPLTPILLIWAIWLSERAIVVYMVYLLLLHFHLIHPVKLSARFLQ